MILVLNLGSSSLKFKVYSQDVKKCLCSGIYEKIGFKESKLRLVKENLSYSDSLYIPDHRSSICSMKKILIDKKLGVINDFSEITSIGHRVVHGGEYFKGATLIDDFVIEKIKKLEILAPIHNSINLEGILDCMLEFPNIPQVAVFDTSFFFDLPEKVKNYPIPSNLIKKYEIRKYGFHGISHEYVYEKYKEISKNKNPKVISCHLGNGSSICAIKGGKAIDISMGFTPLDGVIMGTRSGSLDPAIVTYLITKCGFCPNEIESILNKKSGLLGVSEFSSDIRDLIKKNDKKCNLAIEMYCYSIVKYIGAYFILLNGLDCLIFTGGIGENIPKIREKICRQLSCIGVFIDDLTNDEVINGDSVFISNKESKVDVFISKSDEEFSIAKQTCKYLDFFEKKCDDEKKVAIQISK